MDWLAGPVLTRRVLCIGLHLEILRMFLLEKKLLQFGSVQLVQVVGDGLVCP